MKNKIMNLIPYFLFTIIFTIIIVCTKINNIYILTVIYSSISLYLIFNYYKKKELDYKRYLYILWVLLSFMLDIFFFSITNIVVTILLFIIIMFQYYLLKKCTCNKVIKEEPKLVNKPVINIELPSNFDIDNFEENVKQLYIDMQTYFMNLEYDNLKGILGDKIYEQFSSQMEHLEKTNKRAMRENIDIFDFKINDYKKVNNKTTITVSIGVNEDKYTKYLDKDNHRVIRYESYYELILTHISSWKIEELKLLYCHSKKS